MKSLFLILLLGFVACSNNKKEANYYFIKGLNEYQKDEKTKALENYQKAYDLDKNNLKIIKELAFLYADFGNLKKAKEYYREALSKNPHDENALENILKIAYLEENTEEITKYSEQILDKNSLLYKYSKLRLELYRKDYEAANNCLLEVLNDKNYQNLSDRNLYSYYLDIKENVSAGTKGYYELDIYDKFYSTYSKDKNFIEDYVNILRGYSEYRKAEEVLLKAAADIKDNNDLLIRLAQFYLSHKNIKKFKEVMEILEKREIIPSKEKLFKLYETLKYKKNKL